MEKRVSSEDVIRTILSFLGSRKYKLGRLVRDQESLSELFMHLLHHLSPTQSWHVEVNDYQFVGSPATLSELGLHLLEAINSIESLGNEVWIKLKLLT